MHSIIVPWKRNVCSGLLCVLSPHFLSLVLSAPLFPFPPRFAIFALTRHCFRFYKRISPPRALSLCLPAFLPIVRTTFYGSSHFGSPFLPALSGTTSRPPSPSLPKTYSLCFSVLLRLTQSPTTNVLVCARAFFFLSVSRLLLLLLLLLMFVFASFVRSVTAALTSSTLPPPPNPFSGMDRN